MTNQAVAERVERMAPAVEAPRNDATSMLQAIERLVMNPDLDIDRFERMMSNYERLQEREAQRLYYAALAEMQEELPIIEQNGKITIAHKDDRDKDIRQQRIIQSTGYAKYEDIIEACKPVLRKHGFSLSHRADREGDRVVVTGILAHSAGHKEQTILPLPLDTSGSKNNVQGVGSSMSYGRRYTTLMLLNIVSRAKQDADDDGQAASGPARITEAQTLDMRDLLESTGANVTQFLKAAKVDHLEDIEASKFDSLCAAIRRRAAERDAR